ncbi:DUF2334 domain-containing protein [Clostridium lundense]|uniref:DUF2334 domain-containing protein n=1 Tax=Clostridium lundense TaxID=319475 RepID=UPI000483B856|nr:polysaccharide deacetylase family protein [Clostridium lundense]
MMYKKILASILIIINLINFQVSAVTLNNSKERLLIVYDKSNFFGYNNKIISSIEELLGAFNLQVETVNIEKYKKSYIDNFKSVFVLGIEGDFNNEKFLKDLHDYKGNICWIGYGVQYYLKDNNKYALKYIGEKTGIYELYYSNKRENNASIESMEKFIMDSTTAFPLVISSRKSGKIFSYIGDGKKYYPYIINEKNLWYVSRVEDNTILFYIFADVINEILNNKKVKPGKVFVRIEDVHPFRNKESLKRIADYLYKENVPFMIALIPTYIDEKTGYVTTISQKDDFIEAIKYMQEKGGSVILHGYTHQDADGELSGEGFEFWDNKRDAPLNVNMEEYVYKKVGDGILECITNDIYPLAFEAPHYAMDNRGYKEIKKYFSTYVGQYQSNNEKFTTTAFPYTIYNTKNFNKLIPENMGFVNPDNPATIKEIEENFREISIVNGYTAGFFFHPYLDIKYLKEIIEYLKDRDVEFFNLKNEDNWVRWNNISIYSHLGRVKVEGDVSKNYKNIKRVSYILNINNIVLVIVGTFSIVFLVIILLSKKRDRDKYFR